MNDRKGYIEQPTPFRFPYVNKNWKEVRDSFEKQRRYLTGVVDVLFTQKAISGRTAHLLEVAIRDLETCLNELEIALRTEMQEKEEKNEDN